MSQPIFMVGARGCCKTTVGSALARALGYQFADTDLFMQQTSKMSVAEVVANEGWHGFRQRESVALQQVTQSRCIIATGGGMVLSPQNRQFMCSQGIVIYMFAPATLLGDRLEACPETHQRPSLTGRPIVDEMADVLVARETLYLDVAHHVVAASATPDVIVAEILQMLRVSAAS